MSLLMHEFVKVAQSSSFLSIFCCHQACIYSFRKEFHGFIG